MRLDVDYKKVYSNIVAEYDGYTVTGIFSHWEPFSKQRVQKLNLNMTPEQIMEESPIKLTKGDDPIYMDVEDCSYDMYVTKDDSGNEVLHLRGECWSRSNY
jgi:hypothetical protein